MQYFSESTKTRSLPKLLNTKLHRSMANVHLQKCSFFYYFYLKYASDVFNIEKKHCKLHFFLAPFENFLLKNFPLNGKIEL